MRKRGSRLSHRIAGGAIVVREDRILLVRYRDQDGGTFLVAPGGGALEHESVSDAAVRETFEETGVRVVPGHALLIEDILTDRFKMCKVWFACSVAAGEATATVTVSGSSATLAAASGERRLDRDGGLERGTRRRAAWARISRSVMERLRVKGR